ncbi:MAG TPA: Rieske (2Fe-2S) protein [Drouetiella sp.]|jgi:nitrite reductase/ring-hydroxylating ferredoxin subunit
MAYVSVAKVDEVAQGKGICVKVGRKSIALFNVDGNFYALDDFCPHKGAPLAGGYLSQTDVTCPWHGASFDLASGNGTAGPCGGGVTSYPVNVNDDDIEIGIEESSSKFEDDEDEYDFEQDDDESEDRAGDDDFGGDD